MFKQITILFTFLLVAVPTFAHGDGEPIHTDETEGVTAEFDIVFAQVVRTGSSLVFQMVVDGEAGAVIPEATGDVPGSNVHSYVWPTSLDSSAVGFKAEQGILALAVTSHPDFDDTPLWDEDGDGDATNDGALWHSHWIVLVTDETCEAGLKILDIPEGESPTVPATWPELPILIDSPNYPLELFNNEVVVTVPAVAVGDPQNMEAFNFDGVTAGLQVNANLHNPFLCVTGVDDIASGDLSLPGVAGR
ncbi:MAG: hypothetical protein AAGK74_11595 [Chloroflexota bacterium]